jgi:hypothetical protein
MAQEEYQPIVMDLILKCKVSRCSPSSPYLPRSTSSQAVLARVSSVRRWIAVRIIQRFFRFILYDDRDEVSG